MAEHPSRLGRGLGALLAPRPPVEGGDGQPPGNDTPVAVRANDGESQPAAGLGATYREVPIAALHPNPRQPRTVLDDDALAELAASIAEVGVLQPIVVRTSGQDQYEIVMGERRWRAAAAAGLETVPVLVRETQADALLRDALLENLHRADLNPLDEAAAYAQLLDDFGATHEQLATRLGRSRAHVSNTLRLMQLPAALQRRLAAGVLSAGHARALLALGDAGGQEQLAARIVAEGLSVRAVEEIVAVGSADPAAPRNRRARTSQPEYADVAEALSDRWDTRVRVQAGRTKGRVVIEYGSVSDLDRILGIVAPEVRETLQRATAGTYSETGRSG